MGRLFAMRKGKTAEASEMCEMLATQRQLGVRPSDVSQMETKPRFVEKGGVQQLQSQT